MASWGRRVRGIFWLTALVTDEEKDLVEEEDDLAWSGRGLGAVFVFWLMSFAFGRYPRDTHRFSI